MNPRITYVWNDELPILIKINKVSHRSSIQHAEFTLERMVFMSKKLPQATDILAFIWFIKECTKLIFNRAIHAVMKDMSRVYFAVKFSRPFPNP